MDEFIRVITPVPVLIFPFHLQLYLNYLNKESKVELRGNYRNISKNKLNSFLFLTLILRNSNRFI